MPKKVSIEPGFEVEFSNRVSAAIKNDPTSISSFTRGEILGKRLDDIYARNPLEGDFRTDREIKRMEGIKYSLTKLNTAIKIGVQPKIIAGGRASKGIMIGEVDMAMEKIYEEFDRFLLGYDDRIFSEPAFIESSLRSQDNQGSGLVALANACFILTKHIEEKRPEYQALRAGEDREIFSPLKAYRNGYSLAYLKGISEINELKYMESIGSQSPEGVRNAEMRNASRTQKKEHILQHARIQSRNLGEEVARMRSNGIHEIEFQLRCLLMRNNPQVFDVDKEHLKAVESCITKFWVLASPEEKNIVSSCVFLRKVLAAGGSSGAAAWHIWAPKEPASDSLLFGPLTASALVLESLLRPAKSNSLTVYKTERKPKDWNFMEFDLVGSRNNGRIFVAHRWNANTGDANGFIGHGDLWVVLRVDKDAHSRGRVGRFTDKHEEAVETEFNKWYEFGLKDPFAALLP